MPFDDDVPICFEGPEKRLEVDFCPNAAFDGNALGLRQISQERWQEMLDLAKCTIISRASNEHFDSFVLSESSLFVYPYKVMLKTCGTTTLLRCVQKLLQYGGECGLSAELVMFSRKNLTFPDRQHYPHADFKDEVTYLNQFFDGSAYVLGPVTAEHWYLYLADLSRSGSLSSAPASPARDELHQHARPAEETLEIMMHDLDRSAAQTFYKNPDMDSRTPHAGIESLVPGSVVDGFNFDPCGYSCNSLLDDKYWTVHVTPEPQASFASFETNLPATLYPKVVARVLDLFQPLTATITVMMEKHHSPDTVVPKSLTIDGYKLQHRTFSQLDGNCDLAMWNYVRVDAPAIPESVKRRKVEPKLPLGSPLQ